MRYRFRGRDFDQLGMLTPEALRGLSRALWDCPPSVRVVVDLGPCHQLQDQLIIAAALLPCARSIRFVGSDWRTVVAHGTALTEAITVVV